ncbi:hypothetical protein ACVWZK_007929 [Bradyrhizobium sp. GM0.4]
MSAAVKLLLDGPYGARFGGELAASRQGYFSSRIEVAAQPDPNFVETIARQHAIGVTRAAKSSCWQAGAAFP